MTRFLLLPAALLSLAHAAEAQDAAAGETAFRQCAACHSVAPGQNGAGPSLHGIVGRAAGTVDGARYSDAMRNSGIIWTEAEIIAFITAPRDYLPGTSMAFRGTRTEQQAIDIAAYLATLTDG